MIVFRPTRAALCRGEAGREGAPEERTMTDVANLPHRNADRPASARVVAFPGAAKPRVRMTGEPVGQILLFTGVRYERPAEPAAQAPRRPRTKPGRGRRQA